MSAHVGNEVFQEVGGSGWSRGLGNLWQGEYSKWFRSTRWLKHLALWLIIVNLMMLFMAFASQEASEDGGQGPEFLFMYGIFGGMFVAFGVMIIMHRAIVGEKREGTAAWVLSKPVTRSSFVLSRWLGNALGILVTSTLIPAILVYITAGLLTPLGWLPPLGFAAGVLIFGLHVLFWLTLTLMLGTFFESTAGVMAVPIGLYFALWFIPGIVPSLLYVNPLVLTFAEPEVMQSVGAALMSGAQVDTWTPVITTGIFCAVFLAVSLWRFNREEF